MRVKYFNANTKEVYELLIDENKVEKINEIEKKKKSKTCV